MGASLSWLAVKGKPSTAVLGELRLRATGEQRLDGDAPFVGATSDDGWFLIVARDAEHRIISPAVVEPLSAGCEVLTCTVEEHVMFSEAAGWQNGRRLWRVTHSGVDGPVGLEEEGALPLDYLPIRDRLTSAQEAEGGPDADVDHLFDIPVALVQTVVGYRHDEESAAFADQGFEMLVPEQAQGGGRSWIGRLFG